MSATASASPAAMASLTVGFVIWLLATARRQRSGHLLTGHSVRDVAAFRRCRLCLRIGFDGGLWHGDDILGAIGPEHP